MILPPEPASLGPRSLGVGKQIAPGEAARLFELAIEGDDERATEIPEELPGDCIGPYRLMEKLGEGGFGIVWQAEQLKPIRRHVAVKVLRPGMDSQAVLRRFRAEQRALERMEHPNIAAVLDAGMTAPGRPYFVLELVRGRPITTYCEQFALPLRERLGLFLEVCRAVQHAHQRAVLHRDLKPSNILISEAEKPPIAKVIDFGIATALTEDDDADGAGMAAHAVQGLLLGTPQYMAPEQAQLGAQITDVRVDVYALGTILYELLTGAPPIEGDDARPASMCTLLKRIHEEDAVKPSARVLARRLAGRPVPCAPEQLCGDIDWIVLKALEKSPDRRYESANALADDIRHYLADEPVNASPPSRWYRFKKRIRRNRLTSAISAVIGLNLVLLAVISTYGFLRESEARANAETLRQAAEINAVHAATESQKASALAEFLSRLLEQAGTLVEQGKNPEALRLAVDQSITSVQALNDQPELQAELLGRLAAIYKAMGDSKRALPLFEAQLDVSKRIFGENDPQTLRTLLHVASVTSEAGEKAKSLLLYEELKRRWDSRKDGLSQGKTALRGYAHELARQGQAEKAVEIMKLTLSRDAKGVPDVASLRSQAEIQTALGLDADAEKSLLLALQQLNQNTRDDSRARGVVLQALARCEVRQEKLASAIGHLAASIECERSEKGEHSHTLIDRRIEISRLYAKTGRVAEALRSVDEAVAIARHTGNDGKLPKALRAAGEIREQVGQLEAALAFRRECMGLERRNNTDRGKWLYELAEIVRLLDRLALHDEAEKNCVELWKGIQAEPQAQEDAEFIRGLYATMAEVCERWQQATGNMAHAADIAQWRRDAGN